MGIRCCPFIQLKQPAEVLPGEVSLHILLLVHHTAAQRFLVRLPLEDLFFNGASLVERSTILTRLGDLQVTTIHPYTRQGNPYIHSTGGVGGRGGGRSLLFWRMCTSNCPSTAR